MLYYIKSMPGGLMNIASPNSNVYLPVTLQKHFQKYVS